MKTFVLLLVFAAFLQTTIVAVNLCLLLLVCRSFIREERVNYLLAFGIGIFLGILSVQNIGFWAFIFLIAVKAVNIFRKLPLISSFLTIIPIGLGIILATDFLQSLVFHQTINTRQIIVEAVLILPIYLAVRFWEERFSPPQEIKLRIKG